MDKIIFFTALVVFPFGQLFKLGSVNLFDILIFLVAFLTLLKRQKYPSWYRSFFVFVLFALFSWVLNYFIFGSIMFLTGLMYLLRLVSYSLIGIYVFNNYKNNKDKEILNSKLLLLSICAGVFGWIQYFLYPDLTSLKYLGWDDHLLRMIGTFLDPTFLGLIFVLGSVIAINKNKNKSLLFLVVSIAFTYSRISYLLISLLLLFKKKYVALLILGLSILMLPKMIGEGTNLARTASGFNKLENYKETIEIIKKSPVVGVGYNNICAARKFYLNDLNTDSHSCSGSDSSILFLIATTGVVGFILFTNFIFNLPRSKTLIVSFMIILIHSLFANSMFYSHIMFWMFTLIGLETEVNS